MFNKSAFVGKKRNFDVFKYSRSITRHLQSPNAYELLKEEPAINSASISVQLIFLYR